MILINYFSIIKTLKLIENLSIGILALKLHIFKQIDDVIEFIKLSVILNKVSKIHKFFENLIHL
jgi:hypothetical protein